MIYDVFLFRMTLLLVVLLCGCRTEYVPVESVRIDSVIIASLDRDSIFVRDSVFIREKGDTVYKYKDKMVYVYRCLTDTMYVYRDRDVEVPVPVVRKLTWWEKMKMDFGGWVVLAVALYVVFRTIRWVVLKHRKSDNEFKDG